MEVVGCAASGLEAVQQFRETRPDVTLMDITLAAGMNGIEAAEAIRREFPGARIIMLTVHQQEGRILRALEAGAATYLLKETLGEELVKTIRLVHAGEAPVPAEIGRKLAEILRHPRLTSRELEVLELMADGLQNKEIAYRLDVSKQTAMTHIKNIFKKLEVQDRTQAVMVALQRGLIDFPGID